MKRFAALALAALSACRPDSTMVEAQRPDAPAAPDEAKLVFFREAGRNDRRDYAVFLDEEAVGFSRAGARFEVRCSPGPHLVYLRGAEDVAVRATLAPGMTYYFRISQEPELWRIRLILEPLKPGTPEFQDVDATLDSLRREEAVPEILEAYLDKYGALIEERRDALRAAPETAELHNEEGRQEPPPKKD